METKKWEIGAGRITTNFLAALIDAIYIRKRWKEFFPNVRLDGFVFNKSDLYVSIWNIETKEKALLEIYSNHHLFFEKLIPLFEKETDELWKSLKSLREETEKDNKKLIKFHERFLELFGQYAIYTPIVRFAESALQKLLKEKGINEEITSKLIKPSYKGAQFYLNKELTSIAKIILEHPLKEEIISNLGENFPKEDYLIYKRLLKLKEECGWIKSYINFYKDVEVNDLINDLKNLIEKGYFEKTEEEQINLELTDDVKKMIELFNFVIDMKNKIQNVQAYIFYLGNIIYNLVSKETGIELEDIEWLTKDELSSLLEGFSHDKEVLTMIIQKRKEGILIDPRSGTIITDKNLIEDIFSKQNISLKEFFGAKENNVIQGNFINKKEIVGRVFLALSHDDLNTKEVFQDSILVTMAITPEYTPYLTKFKAVISDEGGIASHGAIVSREMGISMIVGAQGATSIFKDGDKIVMKEDGRIEFLDKK